MRSILWLKGWVLLSVFLLQIGLQGAVTVTELSDPTGIVAKQESADTGTLRTLVAPEVDGEYSFGYWESNGNRLATADGTIREIVQVTIGAVDITYTARYFKTTDDTDVDGLPDWYEQRIVGNLSMAANGDPDGDGFSNLLEYQRNLNPIKADQNIEGGTSIRNSNALSFADRSLGLYLDESTDDDNDSLPDRYEIKQFGNLAQNSNGDTDGDGFSNLIEHQRGMEANRTEEVTMGGTSVRNSNILNFADRSLGLWLGENADNDNDNIPDLYELKQFDRFDYGANDDTDGDGFSNLREYQLGMEANRSEEITSGGTSIRNSNILSFSDMSLGLYLDESIDDDNDSLPDRFEIRNFGDLLESATGDFDGDGFSNLREYQLGMEANRSEQLVPGGTAIRNSNILTVTLLTDSDGDGLPDSVETNTGVYVSATDTGTDPNNVDSDGDGYSDSHELGFGKNPLNASSSPNRAPSSIILSNSQIWENMPSGTAVGKLTAVDLDINSSVTISLTDGNGSEHNDLFFIDENSSLNSASILDFEANSTLNIRVSAKDEHNASLEKTFTVDLINMNERPTHITAYAFLRIKENQPLGTEIGEFNATDQDANSSHTYKFVDGNGSGGNSFFAIDSNGTLTSAAVFDYENNESNYSIRVRVADEHNASLEKTFTINLIDQNEPPVITHIGDQEINGELYQDITINENSGLNIEINATDPDNDILSYFKTAGGDRNLFNLNASSGLFSYSLTKFDYENPQDENADNIYIVWMRVLDGKGEYDEKRLRIIVNNVIEDNDGDGIEDFYDPDDDNDGFSDSEEIAKGTDPFDHESVPNAQPSSLTLNNLRLFENLAAGSIIGEFNATDPDANSTLTISLVDGNGSNDNHLFIIDENDSLRTTRTFDYETDDQNYSILVAVTDEHNLSIERTFTIPLLNIVEDLDSDGIEDFYDKDDDNDGFPDTYEVGYGSNPRDANSTANLVPDLLDLNGSVVEWNSTAGTVVGQFMVNDPDVNASLALQFVDTNDTDHDLFMIDANYSLLTVQPIPYERALPALLINVKLSDEWNASIEKTFEIVVTAKPIFNDSNQTVDSNETILDGNQSIIDEDNLVVDENQSYANWWGNERPDADGWVIDSAMGTFRPHENGWFYHLHLGWLYAAPIEDDSLWIWSKEHRWLWTRRDMFPFVYRWEDANWLYFFLRSDRDFHIFNYASDSYE
ncbi:MAG: hypothetical protein CMI19_07140 [Opitutae bacterium]|nr:hypothetical protein [Opitutae bacterium]